MNALTFTIHRNVDDRVYFHLRDTSNRKLLTSNDYNDFASCLRDLYMIQRYDDYELIDDPQSQIGHYRFCLQTPSGNLLARSTRYYSALMMSQDIATIEAGIAAASTEDYTTTVRFFRPVMKSSG